MVVGKKQSKQTIDVSKMTWSSSTRPGLTPRAAGMAMAKDIMERRPTHNGYSKEHVANAHHRDPTTI